MECAGRESTASPAVCLLRMDLSSLAFCTFGVAPVSRYVDLHQSLIGLEVSLVRTVQSCVPLCVRKRVTYVCCFHNTNRQVMGIYCIRWYFWAWCWLCLTLLYLLWGWYWQSFCHLFLSQALSCGLTSFHAPWAVPSPMTRVWAGLLTCAINTFFPSGWYWAWSKSLVGTFSNSYGVLSGGMHTMLLHLPCYTGPACLTEANLSPVIDVGVSATPASWGSWSWALHLYIGIACLNVELELGSVLVALCPCIETKQMIVALLWPSILRISTYFKVDFVLSFVASWNFLND